MLSDNGTEFLPPLFFAYLRRPLSVRKVDRLQMVFVVLLDLFFVRVQQAAAVRHVHFVGHLQSASATIAFDRLQQVAKMFVQFLLG